MPLSDFGPLYTETDLSRFPVEPWNAASNLVFLLVFVVFREKTRGKAADHPALALGLPILLIGFFGGTLFHATRSWRLWLMLDFVPIIILGVLASLHFWLGIIRSRIAAVFFVLFFPFCTAILRAYDGLPRQVGISIGYIGVAAAIVVPALLLCRKRGWSDVHLLLGALGSFGIAICCRILDPQRLLPMGTHFLWHLFGGLSAFLMMEFMLRSDRERAVKTGTA